MTRPTAPLLGLLLALSVGVGAAAQEKDEPPKRRFTRDIPRKTWVPIYFESIDKRAKSARLPTLRAPLPEGEVELRVWEIDSLTGVGGFRLRRRGALWAASYFGSVYSRGRVVDYERRLAEPKSGWEGAWNRLAGIGVLELPDAQAVGCSMPFVKDGFGYVVETNVGRAYRTYLYDHPDYAACAEAKRMLSVTAAIADEFGLGEFKPPDDSPREARGGLDGRK